MLILLYTANASMTNVFLDGHFQVKCLASSVNLVTISSHLRTLQSTITNFDVAIVHKLFVIAYILKLCIRVGKVTSTM